MPESECRQCKEKFVAQNNEGLKHLELQHHRASSKKVYSKMLGVFVQNIHTCNSFTVFDDRGFTSSQRAYAHGRYRSNL